MTRRFATPSASAKPIDEEPAPFRRQMTRHMKKQLLLATACAAVLATAAADDIKPPPVYYQVPPVLMAPPATSADEQYVYDQRPLPQQPMLITPQQAQEIVDRFRTNYPKFESPRVLIY